MGKGSIAALLILLSTAPAGAQYFGQNKVQYQKFKFQVLKTEHFDLYYYPEEEKSARDAARMAERWNTRLSRILNHELRGRQPVILYASHPEFAQTNVVEGEIGEGTGGVTEGLKRRVTLPFGASLAETDHVLGHELVHAFQYDMLGPGVEGVPLWFIEGMAEYLSVGSRDVQTAMWLRDAAIQNHLPTFDDLDDPRFFPYRFGHALWAYIGARWGDETIGRILHRMSQIGGQGRAGTSDAIAAIEALTQKKRKDLTAEWHASIRETYALVTPTDLGTVVGDRSKDPGALNVGPALSPDGTRVAYLSSRDRLSIDLFLADASTGKVIRKLIATAADPHFESLQFLASAGAWDPAGKRLAIATLRDHRAVIAIVDTDSGRITREVPIEGVGEIFQPAWSPTADVIAFSGQTGGVTDLFTCDLATGATKQLTHDSYADLQPAWSPDGRQLAFVTDRFTTQISTFAFSGYRLGLMTVSDSGISPLETNLDGNIINPQFSTNGRHLYFIADAGGRQNAYRFDLASGRATRWTDEATGVAGITPLSPALSIAGTGGRAAVSIFRDRGYELRIRELTPDVAVAADLPRDQAVLPPGGRRIGEVMEMLRDPSTGLPPASTSFEQEPYSSGLELVDIGQSLGATTGQFGTYANGGIQMTFSDILGNHMLGTGFALNGSVRDIAASVNYLNRTSRWNWGVFAQRLPLVTGSVATALGVRNGQTVFVQQTEIVRQTYSEGGVTAAYPLSRATRVEVIASASHIGFSDELRTQTADLNTGELLSDDTRNLTSAAPLRLAQAGGALVRDTSIFGATSPILGQRFRFEVMPTFGDLRMTNVTADFRQYVMPFRPVTLAGRALHIGRYSGSGEDQRLLPLYLGYPSLVRGYDVGSFGPADCTPNAASSCPEFDRLVGSRVLVVNAEVRAPLVGLFTRRLDYGPLPVELLGFFDTGVAWTRTERPSFSGGSREWVSSVGAGARVNVFGYLIAEFNLARALNRPHPGWTFVFNLQPGF